jgi:hypothetical protein
MGSKRSRTPEHPPPPRLPSFYHGLIHPGVPERPEAELWSNVLPSVPEEEEATDSVGVTSASHITPESQSREPPAKKQRIECAPCGISFTKKKSLYRHQRESKSHRAEYAHQCDECGHGFPRLDSLRRHIQRSRHFSRPYEGEGNGILQGPRSATQQGSSHSAQDSQGIKSQPQTSQSTAPSPTNGSTFVFAGHDPTKPAVTYSDLEDAYASVLAMYGHHTQTDSQAFTALAAELDLQNSGYVAVSSESDWTLDQSSIGYQRTPISALSTELTPATSKLSPASSAHGVATKPDGDNDDDAELAALAVDAALAAAVEQRLSLNDVPYASAKPVWQGWNLRTRRIKNPTPCPLCGYEFGYGPHDCGDVEKHLERHKKRIVAIDSDTVSDSEVDSDTVRDSEAECTVCQIHFLDLRDLNRHRQSVQRKHRCGFNFDHHEGNCTGHHPPTIEGRANLDHQGSKSFLREWEAAQRRAFSDYVSDYANGTIPTNSPAYQEVPQRRAFKDNLGAYKEGGYEAGFGSGRPACRRSTGSLFSVMSFKTMNSGFSTKTTPGRFRYGEEVDSNSNQATRNDSVKHAPLMQFFGFRSVPSDNTSKVSETLAPLGLWLAEAFANKNYHDITSTLSQDPILSLHAFSEKLLSVKMKPSWFYSDLDPGRFRCLEAMVERGLNISESSVELLTAALDGAAAEELLFTENSPLEVRSRLVRYAFLHAATRGRHRVVSKLLAKLSTYELLETMTGMPDLDFIQGLHGSTWFDDEPPLDDILAESSSQLGPCALILALSAGQYRAASILAEQDFAHYWGFRYFKARKSAVLSLVREINRFHKRGETLPKHLDLLDRKFLDYIDL